MPNSKSRCFLYTAARGPLDYTLDPILEISHYNYYLLMIYITISQKFIVFSRLINAGV
jgi:hypothetical protein